MDHGFHSVASGLEFVEFQDVGLNGFVVGFRLEWLGIEEAECVVGSEQRDDLGADASTGPGDEDSLAHERLMSPKAGHGVELDWKASN